MALVSDGRPRSALAAVRWPKPRWLAPRGNGAHALPTPWDPGGALWPPTLKAADALREPPLIKTDAGSCDPARGYRVFAACGARPPGPLPLPPMTRCAPCLPSSALPAAAHLSTAPTRERENCSPVRWLAFHPQGQLASGRQTTNKTHAVKAGCGSKKTRCTGLTPATRGA